MKEKTKETFWTIFVIGLIIAFFWLMAITPINNL
jgi:hypothetical protein